jgi:Bacterial SH3 domain
MIVNFTPVFVATLLWSTALAVAPAHAQCSDRPGTPTNVEAAPLNLGQSPSPDQIQVKWTNTATERVWWDVEITDEAGNVLELPAGVGRGDQGVSLQISNVYSTAPSTTRCFRVKARTEPNTEGCVSEEWSNRACATTPAGVGSLLAAGPPRPGPIKPIDKQTKPIKGLGKGKQIATAIDDVDIYDGPGGEYTVIGMLRAGVSAPVTGSQEGWYKLTIDNVPGGSGWVAADHLTHSIKR